MKRKGICLIVGVILSILHISVFAEGIVIESNTLLRMTLNGQPPREKTSTTISTYTEQGVRYEQDNNVTVIDNENKVLRSWNTVAGTCQELSYETIEKMWNDQSVQEEKMKEALKSQIDVASPEEKEKLEKTLDTFSKDTYVLEKIGDEKILDIVTKHYKIKDGAGNVFQEIWIADKNVPRVDISRIFTQLFSRKPALLEIYKKIDGVVVKIIMEYKTDTASSRMETIPQKITYKEVSPLIFNAPSDCKKINTP